jgi:hypothetical protein
MARYITELLTELNNDPSLLKKPENVNNYALRSVFQYAFQPNLKFVLPDGEPPYKKDAAPMGMSPANFYQQVKKLYIFTRQDLTNLRREQLFIQLLEGLHPKEADLCVAIKDQTLDSMYPNITAERVWNAGYLKVQPNFRQPEPEVAQEEPKELVINVSDTVVITADIGKNTPDLSDRTIELPQEAPKVETKRRGRPRKTQSE